MTHYPLMVFSLGNTCWKYHTHRWEKSSDADCVTQQMKNGIITGDLK